MENPSPAPRGEAGRLVRALRLVPHPEGGYYREVHRSREAVSTRKGRRRAVTAIYYLLPRGVAARRHRVRSDEVWCLLSGAPLRLSVGGTAAGKGARSVVLGPEGGRSPARPRRRPGARSRSPWLCAVPAGAWQSAESLGRFSLAACIVAPGFEFEDFEMAGEDETGTLGEPVALPSRRVMRLGRVGL